MNLRKALQWLIALACTAAAVLNILYLTGAQPKSVTSIGCAAILALAAAAVWIVTIGMSFFWKV